MSTDTEDHQNTGEWVAAVRKGNQVAMRRAQRREATIQRASKRSDRVVKYALARLHRAGVIR